MTWWACVRIHPNQEQIAIRNLINQDFNYYQPKILERRIKRHKVVHVEVPLFPCYLFVEVEDRWMCLNSTNGVSALLMMGAIPAKVSAKVIDSLRQREENGIIKLPKQNRFEIGDRVTIQEGPFAGQQGLVERMSAKEREQTLLRLLSNQIKVLVDEESLQAA